MKRSLLAGASKGNEMLWPQQEASVHSKSLSVIPYLKCGNETAKSGDGDAASSGRDGNVGGATAGAARTANVCVVVPLGSRSVNGASIDLVAVAIKPGSSEPQLTTSGRATFTKWVMSTHHAERHHCHDVRCERAPGPASQLVPETLGSGPTAPVAPARSEPAKETALFKRDQVNKM